MDKKRILLILLFVAAAAIFAYGLYYLFIRKPTAPLVINLPPVNAPTGILPIAPTGAPPGLITNLPSAAAPLPTASDVARGGITKSPVLTENSILNPTLSSDGKNINFYDPANAKFYRIGADGKIIELSGKNFYNVKKITWSPQGDKGILEYPDESKIFYDFTSGRQTTLPKHWEGFSFDAGGNQIVAKSIATDINNRWLITANPDGTNANVVLPLGRNGDKVQDTWSPAGGVIAFSDTGRPQGFARKQIIPIDPAGETLNPLIVEGLDFKPLWSKDGDKLIYSTYSPDSDYKPEIWITNAQGEQSGTGRKRLNLNTWADKCAFYDNNTVYCAVPETLETGAGFAPIVANQSRDILYKIDLETGLKTLVAMPESGSSMKNLIFSADGTTMYFTDSNSERLLKMQIK